MGKCGEYCILATSGLNTYVLTSRVSTGIQRLVEWRLFETSASKPRDQMAEFLLLEVTPSLRNVTDHFMRLLLAFRKIGPVG